MQRRRRLPSTWPVAVALLFVLPPLLFPFIVMLSTALKSDADVLAQPPSFLPAQIAWDNFVRMWEQVALGEHLINSAIIGSGAAVLCLLVAIPAGYALSRFRFPGRQAFMLSLLVIQMFSPIVILFPLFRLFSAYHLLDSRFGLVLINTAFSTSFAVWLLTRYLDTVPRELEEAAQVDGCNQFQALTRIVAPLTLPGLVATFIFTFMTAWNEFLFALAFVTDESKMPVTIGLYRFIGHFKVQWNLLMGASLLASIPVVVLFLAIQRYLVKGLVAGAGK